jgi:hypothetical protein
MPILAYTGGMWYGSASGAMIDTVPSPSIAASIKANKRLAASIQGGQIEPHLKGTMGKKQTLVVQGIGELVQADWKKRGRMSMSVSIGAIPSAFDNAQAVLNAIATSYNIPGTIGAKINSSGSGGVEPQVIRDALTLGTSATPATGSIDDKLNKVKAETGLIPAAL